MRCCTTVVTMRYRRWQPLDKTMPHEVAVAMRERAAKTTDKAAARYLLLGAETIDHNTP